MDIAERRTGQMKHGKYLIIAALIIIAVGVWSWQAPTKGEADTASHEAPASVEHVEGSDISRVTLTQKAAERLDIQTAEAWDESVNGATKRVIPYSSVIYDADGNTWTYTNPEGLVFVRQAITVEAISGDIAILAEGPEAGTKVVSVGGAMLYGTEFGVGH
jgi:hypothetical protein